MILQKKKQLNQLNARLLERKIEVEIENDLFLELGDKGYSQNYGARPLASVFNKLVTRPLSKKIMSSDIKDSQLRVGLENDKVVVGIVN